MQAHDTDEGIRILFSLKQSKQTFKLQATCFTEKHSQNCEDFQYIYRNIFLYLHSQCNVYIVHAIHTKYNIIKEKYSTL